MYNFSFFQRCINNSIRLSLEFLRFSPFCHVVKFIRSVTIVSSQIKIFIYRVGLRVVGPMLRLHTYLQDQVSSGVQGSGDTPEAEAFLSTDTQILMFYRTNTQNRS